MAGTEAATRRHTVLRSDWQPEPVGIKSQSSSDSSSVQNGSRDEIPTNFDEGACYNTTMKVVKVIVYILLFCCVFILSMFSTSTVLLATSNLGLNKNKTVDQCNVSTNRELDGRRGYCSGYNMLWAWCLFLIICVPYAFVFISCTWNVLFKRQSRRMPTATVFAVLMVLETLNAIGLALMAFMLLPHLSNAVQGTLVLCGMLGIPSVMSVIFNISPPKDSNSDEVRPGSAATKRIIVRPVYDIEEVQPAAAVTAEGDEDEENEPECCSFLWKLVDKVFHAISRFFDRKWPLTITNFTACIIQLISVYVALVFAVGGNESSVDVGCVAGSLVFFSLFVSTRWWQNYIGTDEDYTGRIVLRSVREKLVQLHVDMTSTRHTTQLFASFWKIIVTFIVMIISVELSYTECDEEAKKHNLDWVWVWLTNCGSSFVCYFLVRSAAKMQMRRLGFVLPLVLSFPAMLFFMAGSCSQVCQSGKTNTFMPTSAQHLYFKCYNSTDSSMPVFYVLGSLWLVSFLWITRHVWSTRTDRLAPTAKIFLMPLYDAVLLPQSLLLNTRLDYLDSIVTAPPKIDVDPRMHQHASETQTLPGRIDDGAPPPRQPPGAAPSPEVPIVRKADTFPTIYACATMWHEDLAEMKALLISLFRMDSDQSARENAQEIFKFTDRGYYKYEAHIFFDDAFVQAKDSENFVVNDYVCTLIEAVKQAAREFYRVDMNMGVPTRYDTPYGGRLTWVLPGGNDLVVHLKNSSKIRQRKRWSQVMYMYYLLGYKQLNCSKEGRRELLKNRYILALDGDVDFEPAAVFKLVDMMKRSAGIGAVCGRIHPIGSGPMIWYQKFEYALGHWMQKATEHVIGCVLCSPGCFSLFRGSALFGTILDTYSEVPTEAEHYIMYDQGEDRWLCTLILQNGYRVEYCASSDSLTNSPTTLIDFLKQRRRWVPSTIANVIGLLGSWKRTVAINDNISFLYIAYQFLLLAVSLFGPGMIFMMLCGALPVAFSPSSTSNGTAIITSAEGAFPIWASVLINAIPVVAFTIACFKASGDFQLKMAELLTAVYVLLQLIVLVSICVQITRTSLVVPFYCDPTSIYTLFVVAVFLLCGFFHPAEFTCLIYGFVYYLAIPTMYMLLMIYAICNLHDMSWGTRESTDLPATVAKEMTSRVQRAAGRIFGKFFPDDKSEETTSLPRNEHRDDEEIGATPDETAAAEPANDTTSMVPRSWIVDVRLGDVQCIDQLPADETTFFKELVDVQLTPPDKEAEKKERLKAQKELLKLRNSAASFFLFGNVVFIVLLSILQYHVKLIGIPWIQQGCIHPDRPTSKIDPLGFLFMVVCGGMMLIQACGMMFHRAGTFIHIMATTILGCLNRDQKLKFKITDRFDSYVKKCLELGALNSVENLDEIVEAAGDGRKSIARSVCLANAMKWVASVQSRQSENNRRSRVSRFEKAMFKRISSVQPELVGRRSSSADSLSGAIPGEMPGRPSTALSPVTEELDDYVSNPITFTGHSQDNHINLVKLQQLAESRPSSSYQKVSDDDDSRRVSVDTRKSRASKSVVHFALPVDDGSRINQAYDHRDEEELDQDETDDVSGNMIDTVDAVDPDRVARASVGRNSTSSRSSSASSVSTNNRRQSEGSGLINAAYESDKLDEDSTEDVSAVETDFEYVTQQVSELPTAMSKRRSVSLSTSRRQSEASGLMNGADKDPSVGVACDINSVTTDNEDEDVVQQVSELPTVMPKRSSLSQSTSSAINSGTGNSVDAAERWSTRPSLAGDNRSVSDVSVE